MDNEFFLAPYLLTNLSHSYEVLVQDVLCHRAFMTKGYRTNEEVMPIWSKTHTHQQNKLLTKLS